MTLSKNKESSCFVSKDTTTPRKICIFSISTKFWLLKEQISLSGWKYLKRKCRKKKKIKEDLSSIFISQWERWSLMTWKVIPLGLFMSGSHNKSEGWGRTCPSISLYKEISSISLIYLCKSYTKKLCKNKSRDKSVTRRMTSLKSYIESKVFLVRQIKGIAGIQEIKNLSNVLILLIICWINFPIERQDWTS